MRERTDTELKLLARQAALRDLAHLIERGIPLTEERVVALAKRAAYAQVQADLLEAQRTQAHAHLTRRSWWRLLWERVSTWMRSTPR